jgi:hypothetical protein
MKKAVLLLMLPVVFLMAFCDSGVSPADAAESGQDYELGKKPVPSSLMDPIHRNQEDTLNLVNYYRHIAGLNTVTLDESLNEACHEHLEYMIVNNQMTHVEHPDLPEYTEAGDEAGQQSILAQDVDGMYQAIEAWMNSLYHRIPLLEPGLKSIGWAYGQGYAVLNVKANFDPSVEQKHPIFFPAPQQEQVQCQFNIYEEPNPIPIGYDPPVGNFITIMFDPDVQVEIQEIAFYNEVDQELEFKYDIIPTMKNVLYLIPRSPLEPATRHQVVLAILINGEPQQFSWEFTTDSVKYARSLVLN